MAVHDTADVLLWQDALLTLVPDDGDLWACPWCGKRDNPFWLARCVGCGYLVCNPGGYLFRPVDTDLVTNGYSSGHPGVDFGAAEGSPVFSAGDGVVIEASRDRWAGNVLRIAHEGGIETRYGHLREIGVLPGSFVRMGQAVAWSGSTGAVTGPHLHFEVIVRGEDADPLPYLAP
jgi:murein DD-endopeptidase MepM/ murein hydrolase activator NlpD